MSTGKGIAICGIWIGAGICSLGTTGLATVLVAVCAFMSTLVVVD